MPPNERGACYECITLNFDCICKAYCKAKRLAEMDSVYAGLSMRKRKAAALESESSSDDNYEDLVEEAKGECVKFGVSFEDFTPSEKGAFQMAVSEVTRDDVVSYYVGVCKSPCQRFYREPAPHKTCFDELRVLMVGKHMGFFERKLIQELRRECPSKMRNKGSGGEGIHERSIGFLYIALKHT